MLVSLNQSCCCSRVIGDAAHDDDAAADDDEEQLGVVVVVHRYNTYCYHRPYTSPRQRPASPILLFRLTLFAKLLLLVAFFAADCSSASQTAAYPMPDHVRVAVIIDNSTSLPPYAAKQTAYLESAAKLYSFVEKSLILDQTRLIVSLIRVPARDVLTASRILCRELQSTSNLVAIIVTDVGTALMSYIVGVANEAQIPLVDLVNDVGRYLVATQSSKQMSVASSSHLLEPGFSVYMRPSAALHLTTAVEDLMAVYKWDRMLLLYDRPETLTQMQKLLGDVGIEGVPTEKAVFHLNNTNLFEVTQSIKFRWPTVVVALDESMTAKFLRVALRTGILSSGYSFIITNPNAHYVSMEDFAQNYPNVTLLRFINDNAVTKHVLESARRFEEIQTSKYRIIVPEEPTYNDDIPKILTYNREIPIMMSAALLLDALTLVRRALALIFSPPTPFSFRPTLGLACRSSFVRSSIPLHSPYGKVLLQAILAPEAAFEGMTGTVVFNPKTNFRDVIDVEVLGLGAIGLQKIGAWMSDAAVFRETALVKFGVQPDPPTVKHQNGLHSLATTPITMVPSKVLSPRQLRLHLDEEAIFLLKRSNILVNRTLVSTTIKKKTLIVTTVLEEPYVMLRKDKSKPAPNSRSVIEHSYEGYCIDLLDEIAAMTGFTYRLQIVADGAYGTLNRKTGRWTGMIGEVIEGAADIAVAPLTITYAREQVVDFTKPFMNLGISILYLQPFKEKPSVFSFMQPLAGEIWGYVSLSYVVVTFIFYAVGRFSPYEWHSATQNHHNPNDVDIVSEQSSSARRNSPLDLENHINVFTLANSSWFTAGTLMQQGSDVNPRALSTRIVGGAWWFFSLIIISSYTANLAAFLTVETVYSPFESAEELAKQSKIQYGAVKGGSTENFFRESKIDTYRTMWASMQNRDVFVRNNSEGINRVRSAGGSYAYLMESISLEYIIQSQTLNKDCDLRQVGGLLDSKGYGIATARESPYRDVLSMAILQLQENDRLQLLYNKWWKSSGTCVREETKPKVLGTQNIGGIFAILFFGLIISLISLAAEVLWYARHHNPLDKRPYLRRLWDNFRLITTFHSKLAHPLSHGPVVGNKTHGGGTSTSNSLQQQCQQPQVDDELLSPAARMGVPSSVVKWSAGTSSSPSRQRRSRSFHEASLSDNGDELFPLPVMLPKDIKLRRLQLEQQQSLIDDYMAQELPGGGVPDNLSPRSYANLLLNDNADRQQQQQQQQQQQPQQQYSRPQAGRKSTNKSDDERRPRVPMVSFHSSSFPSSNSANQMSGSFFQEDEV